MTHRTRADRAPSSAARVSLTDTLGKASKMFRFRRCPRFRRFDGASTASVSRGDRQHDVAPARGVLPRRHWRVGRAGVGNLGCSVAPRQRLSPSERRGANTAALAAGHVAEFPERPSRSFVQRSEPGGAARSLGDALLGARRLGAALHGSDCSNMRARAPRPVAGAALALPAHGNSQTNADLWQALDGRRAGGAGVGTTT